MLASDYGEFQGVLRQLSSVFPREIDDGLIETYWRALKDVPLLVLRARAEACIRSGKFFPKPRELREEREPAPPVRNTYTPPPVTDGWTALMNRVMLRVLMAHAQRGEPVASDALRAMRAYKARIAAQMRDGGVSDDDWRDMLPAVEAELERLAA